MAHLAESGWSLYIAFLPTASLAEKLVIGHEWYITSAIQISVIIYKSTVRSSFSTAN